MKKLNNSGIAHLLVLVSLLVVVGVGGVGYYVYTKSSANSLPKAPSQVAVTFTPTDWTLTSNAKLVKDSTQGTVLQTSINGMQDNNKTLASLAASDNRWQQLNDFESASWAAKAVNYRLTTCVDYKYVLENQDMSKFPYVSTFQASIGPIHMSRAVDGRGWLLKQCKTERKTVKISLKLSNIKYIRDSSQSRSQFTTYQGINFAARVFLSDKPKLNPPAKGKIYIKNVTMTAVNDAQAPRSSGFFWR